MADEAQIANRIGLGVETVDPGNAAINKLRDVRREMSAIVALSEKMGRIRTPTATGRAVGSQGAKQEVEEQGRLFSDGVARQQSLFSRAEAEKTRIFQTNSRRRVRTAEEEIARVEEIEIRAQQRRAIREEVRFKQRLSSTPAREQARREAELTTDAQERIDRAARRTEVSRREAELGLTSRYGAQGGQTGVLNRALAAQQERVAAQVARQEAEQLAAEQSRVGLDRAVGGGRNALAGVLARAQQQRLQRQLEEERTYRNNVARGRTAFAGVLERSGEDEGTGRRLQQQAEESEQANNRAGGGQNWNTTTGAVQRIVRNMAIRFAIFYGLYSLKKFTDDSIQAALVASQTERQLSNTARQAGVTMQSALAVGETIRTNADLSRQQAQAVTSDVLRFTRRAGTQGQESAFARAATDLAASRGLANADVAKMVESLSRGQGVEEYLDRDPQALLRAYAQRQVQNRPQISDSLFVGKERANTRPMTQQVSEYIAQMGEAEKTQVVFNEALRQGNEVLGEAARRHLTLEGRLESAQGRWADAHVAVGNFVLQLRPLNDLLGYISQKLDGLDTNKLRLLGSGSNSTLTRLDTAQYAAARSGSAAEGVSAFLTGHGAALEAGATLLVGTKIASKLMETSMKDVAGRILTAGGGLAGALAAAGTIVVLVSSRILENAQRALQREENYAAAEGQRVGQLNRARQQGNLRYYVQGAGPQGMSEQQFFQTYSPEQRAQLFRDNRVQQFVGQAPSPPDRQQLEGRARQSNVGFLPETSDEQLEQTVQKAERASDDFWSSVTQHDEQNRAKLMQAQEGALAKLREFRQGSFRVVEEVAQQTTDRDNPFVKIATDFATSAQRMQEQWGFLGKTTVAYFTDLEQGAIKVRYLEEHFKALTGAMELTNKAEAEMDERRLSPELTREEQATGRLTGSMIRLAQTLPQLQSDYRRVFQGVAPTRIENERVLKAQVQELERVRNLGIGQDEQGRREVNRQVDEAVLGITSRFTPQQIRYTPWLREAFGRANLGQQSELAAQVEDDRKRIVIQVNERRRITEDAQRAIEFRRTTEQGIYTNAVKENRGTMFQGQFVGTLTANERRLIAKGGDLADEALIRFTEKLSPREMGSQLFGERNEAQRRQAARLLEHDAEALAAAQEAVGIQKNILAGLNNVRDAILSGSFAVAIQVLNDTQARVDAEALENANQGVPATLKNDVKVNPYSSSFARYGRGGTPR